MFSYCLISGSIWCEALKCRSRVSDPLIIEVHPQPSPPSCFWCAGLFVTLVNLAFLNSLSLLMVWSSLMSLSCIWPSNEFSFCPPSCCWCAGPWCPWCCSPVSTAMSGKFSIPCLEFKSNLSRELPFFFLSWDAFASVRIRLNLFFKEKINLLNELLLCQVPTKRLKSYLFISLL